MEGADESTELWWHPLTFNELSTGFYFNGFQEYLGEFPDLLRAIFLSKITYPACLGVLATFWVFWAILFSNFWSHWILIQFKGKKLHSIDP